MPSRRSFISAGAVAAAASMAGIGDPSSAEAAPKGPSAEALAQAKALQKALPKARLTDALVEKIAGDIDAYATSAGVDFRKATLRNWDEPDFVFTAGPKAPRR